MAEAQPAVGIVMGSTSDWETMRHAAETLEKLGIAFEARVVSAHRTPHRLVAYAGEAKGRGLKVIVAGAPPRHVGLDDPPPRPRRPGREPRAEGH
jgi:5-(carboxyamino)imidazole ribonucleotide mutase